MGGLHCGSFAILYSLFLDTHHRDCVQLQSDYRKIAKLHLNTAMKKTPTKNPTSKISGLFNALPLMMKSLIMKSLIMKSLMVMSKIFPRLLFWLPILAFSNAVADVKVAFIGDQGTNANARAVLQLVADSRYWLWLAITKILNGLFIKDQLRSVSIE